MNSHQLIRGGSIVTDGENYYQAPSHTVNVSDREQLSVSLAYVGQLQQVRLTLS